MHEIKVPKLGTQIEDAEITEWLAKDGEEVNPRQVLAVLETEKSSYNLESDFKGILHIMVEASDERVKAGALIAVVADSREEFEKIKSQ
jgi:pyruvate/2-oxoglutarate dehydrogenase complex dihydrolipoamide acyltransferase (E2) component